MIDYEKRYARLNTAQKKAVDAIDGPVLVVAGPGTGKTELLSMRVANILRRTDTLASSILCITYTESGAHAMRNRLRELLGQEAYKVAVYTFHGLGSDLITRYPEYFYNGAHFQPADDLATFEILQKILRALPHTNPLSAQMNDEFVYQIKLKNTISDFKRSGLSVAELQHRIADNEKFLDSAEPLLQEFFAQSISKKMIAQLPNLSDALQKTGYESDNDSDTPSLKKTMLSQLNRAAEEATLTGKTTPLTAWRNLWLKKNHENLFVCKDRHRHKLLQAASRVYMEYLLALEKAQLYDYDDMILRVLRALETYPELKFTLQETYQYLLIDEFQDTNGAQMQLIDRLTDNPVHEGRPNIMVVGDDDQAIYSFQGADMSNLLSFTEKFRDTAIISLTDNYRSTPAILTHAQDIIVQNEERLEHILGVKKTPTPHVADITESVKLLEAQTSQDEYYAIAHTIAATKKKYPERSIAVLARGHQEIEAFLPYLSEQDIACHYERSENIFDQPIIRLVILVAKLLHAMSRSHFRESTILLPQIISHPTWNIPPQLLTKISLESYHQKKTWLECMQEDTTLAPLASFLSELSVLSHHTPFPQMLDYIIGTASLGGEASSFRSPLREYFFNSRYIDQDSRVYVDHLRALTTLRTHVLKYYTEKTIFLQDFIRYIKRREEAKLSIYLPHEIEESDRVMVMTAHSAKGQEFDDVYILGATEKTWGESRKKRSDRLTYPANLPLAPSGDTLDEKRRLFFVAMTRAKKHLVISYPNYDDQNKSVIPVSFLQTPLWKAIPHQIEGDQEIRTIAEITWQQSVTPDTATLNTLLQPLLRRYMMSPTHLTNFLDVTKGGPHHFLTQNLLHFPEAMHPAAALGSSVHTALKEAHLHMREHGSLKPVEDVLYDFENALKSHQLDEHDFTYQLHKGVENLRAFLAARYETFDKNQKPEINFKADHVTIGEARITGIIDVMSYDTAKKTIAVCDYKTGKPASSWRGKDDYEKVKLHKYEQQLMFYKLMIEATSRYRSGQVATAAVVFIEPDQSGKVRELPLEWDEAKLRRFKKLIQVVWSHIIQLQLPDTSAYPASYKGILAFEDDLLKT